MNSSGWSSLERSGVGDCKAIEFDNARIDAGSQRYLFKALGVVFGAGSVYGLFLPWITFEMPLTGGTSVVYPWVFVGGRAFTLIFAILMFVGSLLFAVGHRKGVLIMAIPAATVAWFALGVSILGSIFHNFLGFFGSLVEAAMAVDTGDPGAWIRQGPGLTLVIICGFAVGVIAVLQFEPLCRTVWVAKNLYTSILSMTSLIVLLATSQSTWVVTSVLDEDVRIRFQGDQIFGSAVIDALIWLALGIWILSLLSSYPGLRKAVLILTALVAFLRLAQCGFVLAGASLLESNVPRSISIGRDIDRLPGLYSTLAISVLILPISVSSVFPRRVRLIFWIATLVFLCPVLLIAVTSN